MANSTHIDRRSADTRQQESTGSWTCTTCKQSPGKLLRDDDGRVYRACGCTRIPNDDFVWSLPVGFTQAMKSRAIAGLFRAQLEKRSINLHTECPPTDTSSLPQKVLHALQVSTHLSERERVTLSNLDNIVVREDSGLVSAILWSNIDEGDYYQFQIVIVPMEHQRIGDIVG